MARTRWQGLTGAWSGTLGRAWEKGAVEVGAVAVAASLLVGAVAGQGLATVALDVADGVTWLPDDASGQIVEVNPSTGQPQTRLQLAGTGSSLQIRQRDGRLLVMDGTTGQISSVNLATLLASGRRAGAPGGDSKLLVGSGRVYLVDLMTGSLRRVDPITLTDLGNELKLGPLADAVVDGRGTLWLAQADGEIVSVRWSDDADRFVGEEHQNVAGSGPNARLVAHPAGVTVFGSDGGVVVQVGTDKDVAVPLPALQGEVQAAAESPRDLVAAALPDTGGVVLLSQGKLLDLAVGALGCSAPQRPIVFGGRVYVPCANAGRVLVLGPDGRRAAPDILTEDRGTPTLVIDDGRLVVSSPGAATGVVVDNEGNTRTVKLKDESVPVRRVDTPPPPPVVPAVPPVLRPNPPAPSRTEPPRPSTGPGNTPSTSPSVRVPNGPGNGQGPGNGPGNGPGSSSPPGNGSAPRPVTSVVASARADGVVVVSWSPTTGSDRVDSYTIQPAGGGLGTAAPGGATSVQVSGLTAGTTVSFVVVSTAKGRSATSQVSNSVTVAGGGPTTPVPTTAPPTPTPTVTTPRPTTTTPPPTTPPPPPPPTTPPPPPPTTPRPPPDTSEVPASGGSVISSIYQDGYALGDNVYATLGGAWASHKGSCVVIKQLNSLTPTTATLPSCGSQTVTVGRVARVGKTLKVTIRATSQDGSRTSDSAQEAYFIEPDQTSCLSAPASLSSTSDEQYLRAFAPALPPCGCPTEPGTQCPVSPVATAPEDPANAPVDGRYTWAGLLFGGAALLRTLRLRGRKNDGNNAGDTSTATGRAAYPTFTSDPARRPGEGTHR
ncbi:MAG: fibronectin type III domain-containing protein [Knoellia sp.]